jgi:positive regulator of sigma E activity
MLGYFVYVIVKNDMVSSNALLISALTLILVGDLTFQLKNSSNGYVIIPAIIGSLLGWAWAAMLPKKTQMVPQSYEQSKCNVKKGIYRCRIRRTGEIV